MASFSATTTLETPRLLLRPLRRDDVPAFFALMSDPVVMKFWNQLPWRHIEQAFEAIDNYRQALSAGEYMKLGLEMKDGGNLIGTCILFHINAASRRAEIGYCLAADAQGKGYMAEALSGLIDFAFGTLGLNRLEAEIDARNIASAKTLARQSFVQEGLLRQRWIVDGKTSDSALYGLLAAERG
ncbi:GNAT family N-acetyltransferase [Brenneria goodwinii]|uniref:N-acetyltransferase domain-containing protein n=1 Tax=Brenneria goodwinii TaxID=1109412 RepID=A0A0G4JXB0_9GAMM|nr:GNAT family protein [Brenneria goodwinii]MCG8156803.1 GNAT family N-acetyltransferase [Brenneria goodwinii]MCG8160283.1 GNAT family N-acetyltransferase [Brenneria goodwinii]MCG8164806.1 GNAT family N-acetyltransferase [Brenneria goodwinii]MCG8172314.1 GNAT family N-acetyltransferase [Brenneria goodwinii]MCG8174015.1 GNAT family N-acetyltransferase [Brenneria goodwinii]